MSDRPSNVSPEESKGDTFDQASLSEARAEAAERRLVGAREELAKCTCCCAHVRAAKDKLTCPSECDSPEPIPMRLPCPSCGVLHVDAGEFEDKSHHTHACQSCGNVWRPAIVPTVGVRFLPGLRNNVDREETP